MTTWNSNTDGKWDDGQQRIIVNEGTDDDDGRLLVKQLSDNDINFEGYFKILGNGIAEFKSDSARLYVFKGEFNPDNEKGTSLWKPNIEVSVSIKVDSISHPQSGKNFINIGGPTNHFSDKINDNSNGRNYNIRAYYNRGQIGYEKETIHGVYDFEEARNVSQTKLSLGKWYDYKFRQRLVNDSKNVKLEGWLNGNSFGSYTDSGKMTELNDEAEEKLDDVKDNRDPGALNGKLTRLNQIWTIGAYSGCYIRLNRITKGFMKNLTVREL